MLHPSSSSNRYAVKHLFILHSVLLFTVVVRHMACTMSILTCIVLSCNALHCLVVGRRRAPHCALRKPVCHLQSSFKLNSGMKTTPLSLLTDEAVLCANSLMYWKIDDSGKVFQMDLSWISKAHHRTVTVTVVSFHWLFSWEESLIPDHNKKVTGLFSDPD